MKKILLTAAAFGLVFGAASQAFALTSADFTKSLTRVINDPTQLELEADLAKTDALTTGTNLVSGGFGLSDFNAGTNWSDLNLSYFAYSNVTTYDPPTYMPNTTLDIWFASTNNSLMVTDINLSGTNNFGSGAQSVYSQMAVSPGMTVGGTAEILPGAANSFTNKMGTSGTLSTLLPDFSGVLNLASFDAAGLQSEDMYLYHLHKDNTDPWALQGSNGQNYAYVITTFEQGYSMLADAAPVPIPAAAWLLGSGIFGLVGIRRKNS